MCNVQENEIVILNGVKNLNIAKMFRSARHDKDIGYSFLVFHS
jgi:hypothetical protein